MNTYAAAFEIPDTCTLSIEQLKRQALTLLVDMIPADVEIVGEWRFTPRTNRGRRFWLICEAPATGPVEPKAAAELAEFVRADVPDMAAWIDHAVEAVAA